MTRASKKSATRATTKARSFGAPVLPIYLLRQGALGAIMVAMVCAAAFYSTHYSTTKAPEQKAENGQSYEESPLRADKVHAKPQPVSNVEQRSAAHVEPKLATPVEQPKPAGSSKCHDKDAACAQWALKGECEVNAGYMLSACALSCNSCNDDLACKRPNETAAVSKGGIELMFRRLLKSFPQYSPHVLSTDPWVVTLDDFLSSDEARRFSELCAPFFERSLAGDQLSPGRTSHECWGHREDFVHDATVQRVTERIGQITMTPPNNAEYFQVVKYDVGQFYKVHHDQNSAPSTPQGARLYTFFMYLNTPEEGGGTRFNDLGITIEAKMGRVVLWPSLMDQDVVLPELRTHHEALPVVRGFKTGANLWIHQYDFKTPRKRGCELTLKSTYNPESKLKSYVETRQAAGLSDEVPLSMIEKYELYPRFVDLNHRLI